MKKLLILAFALLSIASAKAQFDFDFSFEKRHIFGDQGDNELVAKGYVKNNSGKTEIINWQVTTSQWNSSWAMYVVDKNKQHDTSVKSSSFSLLDGDSVLIELHVNPEMVVFAGEATITLSRQSDPFDLIEDKVKFSVHTLGIRDDITVEKNTFKLYPNPAKGYVNISLDSKEPIEMGIYDAIGKQIIRHTYTLTERQINIESLDEGIYFISYTDKKGNGISQQFKKEK